MTFAIRARLLQEEEVVATYRHSNNVAAMTAASDLSYHHGNNMVSGSDTE